MTIHEFPVKNFDRVKKELHKIIIQRIIILELSKKEVQYKLKIGQPRASQLINGKLEYFSIEALLRYSMILGVKFKLKHTIKVWKD